MNFGRHLIPCLVAGLLSIVPMKDAKAAPCSADKPAGAVLASWYGKEYHAKRTASGIPFDEQKLTAAHPNLPLKSWIRVVNVQDHRSVLVQITDRGGYGRGIDLSEAAARLVGIYRCGVAPVMLQPV